MRLIISLLFFSFSFSFVNAETLSKRPECIQSGDTLSINNSLILHLKKTTRDGTSSGALVHGRFVRKYKDSAEGHPRFQIRIGPRRKDTVEIRHTGEAKLPKMKAGDRVIACGNYVTNKFGWDGNAKSPDGGYVSKTAVAWSPYQVDDGYLVINKVLFNE